MILNKKNNVILIRFFFFYIDKPSTAGVPVTDDNCVGVAGGRGIVNDVTSEKGRW